MFYVDGRNAIGVEVISVPLLVNKECHSVLTRLTLRVGVADEASEGCGFLGYGVGSKHAQVIALGVWM